MAVVNKYTNDLIASGKLAEAAYVNGARTITCVESEELASGDDAASVYRFFKSLNPNLIPIDVKIYVDDAVVGATDVNVGFYETTDDGGTGAIIDGGNSLADAVDLSPAGGLLRGGGVIGTDEYLDGMKGVDIADLYKKIYQHAGHTVSNYKQGYDLALTVISDTTTGGTVTVIAQFIEG